jgi:hypothetical protein
LYSSEKALLDMDLSKHGVQANAVKAVITDYMQEAAQSLLQLVGAKGYRFSHVAGRSILDSRPFMIFEGSNDILYEQLAQGIVKLMRKSEHASLYGFLGSYDLTARASEYFKRTADFSLGEALPQRKVVDLGRALGRIITMELVIELGDRGSVAEPGADHHHVILHHIAFFFAHSFSAIPRGTAIGKSRSI